MTMAYDPKKHSYRWRATVYKCKPEVAAQEFAEIEKEKGELTADLIVKRARPKENPLHNDFTWNNKQAADSWRKHEARLMVSSLVQVRIEKGKPSGKEHRSFVSINPQNEPRRYVNIDTAMSDPEISPRVLTGALNRMQTWLDEYWAYREVAELRDPYTYAQKAVVLLQDAVAKKAEKIGG